MIYSYMPIHSWIIQNVLIVKFYVLCMHVALNCYQNWKLTRTQHHKVGAAKCYWRSRFDCGFKLTSICNNNNKNQMLVDFKSTMSICRHILWELWVFAVCWLLCTECFVHWLSLKMLHLVHSLSLINGYRRIE